MHLTFRQLQVFEAVARHLSFRKAADELHLSQPAVSMQIKQLEENIGLPLFEKLGKKVYLTEAGNEMYHYSRSIDYLLKDAESVIEGLKGAKQGMLKIATASTANYFVPTLLGVFTQRFPDVAVNLNVCNRETLVKQLTENEVDLVVMGQPPSEMELDAGSFMDNPLVIIAPSNHPLVDEKQIPLRRLESESILVREQGSGTRGATERVFQEHGVKLNTGMEISSNEAIKQSVQAGLGLGLISQDTLEMEVALGKVAVLDVVGFPIRRKWYVIHRKGKRLSTVAQAFKDFLLEEAEQLIHSSN